MYLDPLLLRFEIPETHDAISFHFTDCIVLIFAQIVISLYNGIFCHLFSLLLPYLLNEILDSLLILLGQFLSMHWNNIRLTSICLELCVHFRWIIHLSAFHFFKALLVCEYIKHIFYFTQKYTSNFKSNLEIISVLCKTISNSEST